MTITEVSQLLTALAALGAVVMSALNYRAIKVVEHATNSMKDELVAVTRSDARQEGITQGREEAEGRTLQQGGGV